MSVKYGKSVSNTRLNTNTLAKFLTLIELIKIKITNKLFLDQKKKKLKIYIKTIIFFIKDT